MDDRDRPEFRVDDIDHVELFVPDRREAAGWYRRVLGLTVLEEYENWADDPRGPLMIASDAGSTKLALFAGRPQGDRETAGYHLVAFRVSGRNFERFLDRLDALTLTDHHGQVVTRGSVKDHGQAVSLYFNDPYGHRLELTTYTESKVEVLAVSDDDVRDIEPAPAGRQALWLCHVCDTPVPARRGMACSRCYRATCPDCLRSVSEAEPVRTCA